MKKLLLFVAVMLVASCSQVANKYGQGGKNAVQYVKEQVPGLRDDIESIEVIGEDSLLCDIGLTFGNLQMLRAEGDFYEGKISRARLDAIIDSVAKAITDVEFSWKFSNVINDSLRKLTKYDHQWRKVYQIRVTMKSGDVKEPRVLMDQDGITPRCLEKDFEKTLQKYTDDMMGVTNRLIYGI